MVYNMDSMFWDVFLCHNGEDKLAVLTLSRTLEAHGLQCWLDRHTLKPGTEWTDFVESEAKRIRAMVVIYGPHGISAGQQFEIDNLIPEMRSRAAPVIPVVLATHPVGSPNLSKPFTPNTIFVDLRNETPDEIDKLVWAINGRNPFERESVGAYYEGLTSALQGNLRAWLSARIALNHINLSYSKTTDVIAELFTDPNDASHLITYDGQSVEKLPEGQHRFRVWNKDHIWPKAFGYFKDLKIFGDLHNIVPADPKKNSRRGAGLFYDEFLDHDAPLKEALVPAADFDPRGIVARACLYMTVRYQGENGEPTLTIIEEKEKVERFQPRIASLRTLLYWHKIVVVSKEERHRNDRIMELQGNRNPFVDHPELADKIFYPV